MNTAADGHFASRFSRGFFAPFRAARFLLNHPRLLRFILIPFGINTLVFSLAVYFGFDFFNEVVLDFLPEGEAWYWLLLYYLVWVVAVIVTAVLVFFSFTVVGNFIAAPFNDLLSERTEETIRERSMGEPFSMALFLADVRRTLLDEGKKLSLFVIGMVLLLLLNLVPLVGPLTYAVLSVVFTLFFLAVEYTGFVFGRKHLGFREQRRFIFSHRWLMLGFSLGVLALLAIPLAQFFCIPVAVVAATRLWCETSGADRSPTVQGDGESAAGGPDR